MSAPYCKSSAICPIQVQEETQGPTRHYSGDDPISVLKLRRAEKKRLRNEWARRRHYLADANGELSCKRLLPT